MDTPPTPVPPRPAKLPEGMVALDRDRNLASALSALAAEHGADVVLARARLLFSQRGKASRRHPETSHEAARLEFGSQRFKVAQAMAGAVDGMTAAEVAGRVGLSRNQAATRLMELREWGFVNYHHGVDGKPMTRPTGPNTRGRVQFLTLAGRRAVAEGLTSWQAKGSPR